MVSKITDEFLLQLQKDLADAGKLVEAGWIGFRLATIPKGAPDIQLSEMKTAFMAGALHIFTAVVSILDEGEGDEPTETDMRRISLIHAELETFGAELKARVEKK